MVTLIDWKGLKERGITLSRATVYRQMSRGNFPKAIKQGEQKIAWSAAEIDDWIKDRLDARE